MTHPLADSLPSVSVKKKRLLLVDTSRAQRDMRVDTMRRLGIEVDSAADISEARCWWRPDLYDLVLFHVEDELPQMYRFWDDIRTATPSQRVAFLIGKPEYLAASPNDNGSGLENAVAPEGLLDPALPSVRTSPEHPNNWGIMEACRRISAVRSIADARSRALRDKALPPRDSLDPEPKRIAAEFVFDAEIHREEM